MVGKAEWEKEPADDEEGLLQDRRFMRAALLEAGYALRLGEVPVGAVVVAGGRVVGRGHNLRETSRDPTAHAEMVAIREAARLLDTWRLTAASLYVTLEPCPMCAGAIVQSRLSRLVYGAPDPKAGAAGSLVDLVRHPALNHRAVVEAGILEEECREMLREFFQKLRDSPEAAIDSGEKTR